MQRLFTHLRLAAVIGSAWTLASCTEDAVDSLSADGASRCGPGMRCRKRRESAHRVESTSR